LGFVLSFGSFPLPSFLSPPATYASRWAASEHQQTMKKRNDSWLVISLLVLLVACQFKPRFINHSQPNLSVTFDVFNDGGCLKDSSGRCMSESSLAALGCDEIQVPSSLIGGLYPAYPIAECRLIPDQTTVETQAEIEKGLYFFYTGGLFGSYVRYIIFQDGEFRLLKSEDEFRAIYAPVETPEEALSYVLAVTNLSAYYGLEYDPAYAYEVGTIEDTHVTPEPDGYKVHLFHDSVFGCGPHWISEVEMHVSAEGIVQEMSSKPLFRDPNQDDLCVD
jgi:hypothetical protein